VGEQVPAEQQRARSLLAWDQGAVVARVAGMQRAGSEALAAALAAVQHSRQATAQQQAANAAAAPAARLNLAWGATPLPAGVNPAAAAPSYAPARATALAQAAQQAPAPPFSNPATASRQPPQHNSRSKPRKRELLVAVMLSQCNAAGYTPLHHAIYKGNIYTMNVLLDLHRQLGVAPGPAADFGDTALHIAAATGDAKMVKALLRCVDWAAANCEKMEARQALLAMKDAQQRNAAGQTPLALAAARGDAAVAQALLRNCSNVGEQAARVLKPSGRRSAGGSGAALAMPAAAARAVAAGAGASKPEAAAGGAKLVSPGAAATLRMVSPFARCPPPFMPRVPAGVGSGRRAKVRVVKRHSSGKGH
jgi:hypothetical protein